METPDVDTRSIAQGPPRAENLDLSLVLPCYNEEEVLSTTVRGLVSAFKAHEDLYELVLVDNGSTDATGRVIDQLVAEGLPVVKVVVTKNQGYGHGVLRGLRACRGRLVGFVCADGQVEAHDVAKVYEIAARSRTPKLVKVRRRFRMDGFTRKVTSITYNLLATTMFGGLGSIDINGNPKILPRPILEQMHLQSNDWFLDAEVLIRAKQMSLPVFEFNVIAQLREGGRSNVRVETCLEFLTNLCRFRFGRASGSPDGVAQQHQTPLPAVIGEGAIPPKTDDEP
jgi:glycosyltransferase involved in cell wall biosynthesis